MGIGAEERFVGVSVFVFIVMASKVERVASSWLSWLEPLPPPGGARAPVPVDASIDMLSNLFSAFRSGQRPPLSSPLPESAAITSSSCVGPIELAALHTLRTNSGTSHAGNSTLLVVSTGDAADTGKEEGEEEEEDREKRNPHECNSCST